MTAEKKQPPKPTDKDESEPRLRIAALRVFRVTYVDQDGTPRREMVMAHLVNFPHPREVTFHDISIEGAIALQYLRRAIYNWIDVVEETPANTGSTQVQ